MPEDDLLGSHDSVFNGVFEEAVEKQHSLPSHRVARVDPKVQKINFFRSVDVHLRRTNLKLFTKEASDDESEQASKHEELYC